MSEKQLHKLCDLLGYNYSALLMRNRSMDRVIARYIIMRHLSDNEMTLSKAAGLFGLDHSTAIHGKAVLAAVEKTKTPPFAYRMIEKFNKQIEELNIIDQTEFTPFIYTANL